MPIPENDSENLFENPPTNLPKESVTVLTGNAKLLFEEEHERITMRPGDCVLIPAHRSKRFGAKNKRQANAEQHPHK